MDVLMSREDRMSGATYLQAVLAHPCAPRHLYFLYFINEHFELPFNNASTASGDFLTVVRVVM
jgi:hypothetical protein